MLDFPSNGKTPEDDYPAGDPLASAEREGRRGTGTPAGLTESRRSNRRFKYQTVAITAFILAVLVGFSYQIYVEAKGDIEKQFNRQQLFLADQASGRIESFLDKLTSSLLYSASFLRTVGPNHPGRMSAIAGLYEHIGDGVRVSEVGYIREGRETEPQVPAEYLTALRRCGADRGACLLPVNYKGMTDYILGFAPVSEKDWLYAKVTVEDLNRAFVEPVQSGLRGRAWLLDGEGRILIGPGASGREGTELGSLAEQSGDDRLKRIFRRMRRGERGYDWHFDFGAENFGKRKRTLTAFSPLRVESVRWSLAVTAPSSEVVRLVRRTFRRSSSSPVLGSSSSSRRRFSSLTGTGAAFGRRRIFFGRPRWWRANGASKPSSTASPTASASSTRIIESVCSIGDWPDWSAGIWRSL